LRTKASARLGHAHGAICGRWVFSDSPRWHVHQRWLNAEGSQADQVSAIETCRIRSSGEGRSVKPCRRQDPGAKDLITLRVLQRLQEAACDLL